MRQGEILTIDFPDAFLFMILAGALVIAVVIVGLTGSISRRSSAPYGWVLSLLVVDVLLWIRLGPLVGLGVLGVAGVLATVAAVFRIRTK